MVEAIPHANDLRQLAGCAPELDRPSRRLPVKVDLARLENLKRLLNDGTLTREEFEALKQNELQAGGIETAGQ